MLGRFLNMGVEPYQFVSALNCVLAQRLVRLICAHCKRPATVDARSCSRSRRSTRRSTHTHTFYEGAGCIECGGTGFKGRTAICELLDLTDRIREMILEKRPDLGDQEGGARGRACGSCASRRSSGCCTGMTTLREINKVTFVE